MGEKLIIIKGSLNKYLQSQTTGLLRKLALLKDWNTGDLSDLFLHTNSVNLGRNHVLYNIGDSCDHVYIVQDGEVEVNSNEKGIGNHIIDYQRDDARS